MSKIAYIASIVIICIIGGLFFCAGLFTGASVNNTNGDKPVTAVSNSGGEHEAAASEADKLTAASANAAATASTAAQEIMAKADAVKDKISKLFSKEPPTIIDVESGAVEGAAAEEEERIESIKRANRPAIVLEKPSTKVTIDALLSEITASHTTNDQCLEDNIKSEAPDPVATHPDKKFIVFIGYFASKIAHEISSLLSAKGYPVHVQLSNHAANESFVFCGPFEKEAGAKTLLEWLIKHDFTNARIVAAGALQAENIDKNTLSSKGDDIPNNIDNDDDEEHVEEGSESEDVSESVETSESTEESPPPADAEPAPQPSVNEAVVTQEPEQSASTSAEEEEHDDDDEDE